jgi:photosystem II 13kDa protein
MFGVPCAVERAPQYPTRNRIRSPHAIREFVGGAFPCEDKEISGLLKTIEWSIMAEIQFSRGVNETVIPDVRLTRAKDGTNGRAYFSFDNPDILQGNLEILGMYMVDEEGELVSRDVNAKFVNGLAKAIEATYTMKSAAEWDRFIRFMDRYSESHGMGLNKPE